MQIVRISSLALLLLASCDQFQRTPPASTPEGWSVYFSPNGGCNAAIVGALDSATNSVLVQAYGFTSAPLAAALRDAHKRGVKVSVILDDSNLTDKYSEGDFLAHAGIRTLIDRKHGIAHNKVMIVDETVVITGSFNFTKAAEERNAENLLVIQDRQLARQYLANWRKHESHSEEYKGR